VSQPIPDARDRFTVKGGLTSEEADPATEPSDETIRQISVRAAASPTVLMSPTIARQARAASVIRRLLDLP
jgi:hypothetical protein